MPTIKKFEDIEAWKMARELTRRIYEVSGRGDFRRDAALRNQIRRAAVSVASDIAEVFERDGNVEFRQFLSVAKGSLGELRTQLYIALDGGFLQQNEFDELQQTASKTGSLIAGMMAYLRTSELRGLKYRDGTPGYVSFEAE